MQPASTHLLGVKQTARVAEGAVAHWTFAPLGRLDSIASKALLMVLVLALAYAFGSVLSLDLARCSGCLRVHHIEVDSRADQAARSADVVVTRTDWARRRNSAAATTTLTVVTSIMRVEVYADVGSQSVGSLDVVQA